MNKSDDRFVNLFVKIISALFLAALCGYGLAQTRQVSTISLPSPATWLTHDAKTVFALLESGEVWVVGAGQSKKIASNWSSDAPIVFAHGRLHGVGQDGELKVLQGNQVSSSQKAALSGVSRLLPLPFGVIAIAQNGDLLRLENNSTAWTITARAKVAALPDARLTYADLDGDGESEVVALLEPSATRYRHGVLGDALEPTALAVFERHSLETLWRLDLPAPLVFEDIEARPLRLAGRDRLALALANPTGGAALALVSLEKKRLGYVQGTDFRQPNRWLNPLVGSGELYAVHTPHIGGRLHRYGIETNRLVPTMLTDGVSSHAIGSRNLEPALVLKAGKLALPSQDQQNLVFLDCQKTSCQTRATHKLLARYNSNMLLLENHVVIADAAKKLHWIPHPF
jgi:hypothetical protein